MQCISRAAQHLPISLLEITTAGHSLYTLLTYILRAQKPMNISRPTLIAIRDKKLRRLAAYMFTCSPLSGPVATKFSGREHICEFDWIMTEKVVNQFVATATPFTLRRDASGPGTAFSFDPPLTYLTLFRKRRTLEEITLNPVDMERWTLAWEASSRYKDIQSGLWKVQKDSPIRFPTRYVVLRASNAPNFDSSSYSMWPLGLAFAVSEVVYGTIHALGWNSTFASFPRQLVWRIVSCVIGGGGLYLGGWLACMGLGVMMPSMIMLAVVEVGLRMFLLIEAVLNIAVLPDGVYQSPQWVSFIPHWA
jgi:hypothetical protein